VLIMLWTSDIIIRLRSVSVKVYFRLFHVPEDLWSRAFVSKLLTEFRELCFIDEQNLSGTVHRHIDAAIWCHDPKQISYLVI
jgi:hypothetical protein